MYLFLYIFSIFIGYYGLLGLFAPQEQRRATWSLIKIIPLKLWAVFNIILGVVFFYFSQEFLPFLMYFIAFLFFLEAILLIFFPTNKIKQILKYWLLLSNNIIRLMGLFYLIVSILFFILLKTYA